MNLKEITKRGKHIGKGKGRERRKGKEEWNEKGERRREVEKVKIGRITGRSTHRSRSYYNHNFISVLTFFFFNAKDTKKWLMIFNPYTTTRCNILK